MQRKAGAKDRTAEGLKEVGDELVKKGQKKSPGQNSARRAKAEGISNQTPVVPVLKVRQRLCRIKTEKKN